MNHNFLFLYWATKYRADIFYLFQLWNDYYLGYSWNIIGNILSSLGSLFSNHILRISRTILICKNLGDFGMVLLEYSWWEKFILRRTFILHKEVQSLLFIYCNWQDFYLDLKIEEFAWYKLAHSKMSLDILYNVMWVLAEQSYPNISKCFNWCRQKGKKILMIMLKDDLLGTEPLFEMRVSHL